MSLCSLGLSCEPVEEAKLRCVHGLILLLPCDLCAIEGRINQIEKEIEDAKISQLWAKVNDLIKDKISIKKPHKCPICEGVGRFELDCIQEIVRNNGSKNLICNPCEGKGIVWG